MRVNFKNSYRTGKSLASESEIDYGNKLNPCRAYERFRNEERAFIKNNKKAPVIFSKTNNYIRIYVNGKWHTLNGWSKESYLKTIE